MGGWNSVCPECGANIEIRVGGRTKKNFLAKIEIFKCECCGWQGTIKGGRTVGEGWGRP